MPERRNVMFIHSWAEPQLYHRAQDLVKAYDSGIADYSVPAWDPIPGPDRDVEASIRSRISTATAVVVINTDGLHRREGSSFEMKTAVEMGKRIIVLQPDGNFRQPIPKALDGAVYRFASWRSGVLGRAIRGEYPHDGRVFDIAELVDRKSMIQCLAVGAGVVSLAVLAWTAASYRRLAEELAAAGVQLEWSPKAKVDLAAHVAGGALLVGGITALLTGDVESTVVGAVGGALVGAAVSSVRTYQAMLHGTSRIRVLALAGSDPS